jgi:hypothetical protein
MQAQVWHRVKGACGIGVVLGVHAPPVVLLVGVALGDLLQYLVQARRLPFFRWTGPSPAVNGRIVRRVSDNARRLRLSSLRK